MDFSLNIQNLKARATRTDRPCLFLFIDLSPIYSMKSEITASIALWKDWRLDS